MVLLVWSFHCFGAGFPKVLNLVLTLLSQKVVWSCTSTFKQSKSLLRTFSLKPFSCYDGKMQRILDSNATHGIFAAALSLSVLLMWSKVGFGTQLDRRCLGNSRGVWEDGDFRGWAASQGTSAPGMGHGMDAPVLKRAIWKVYQGVYDIKDLFMPATCPSSSLLNPVLPFWDVTCHLSQCTSFLTSYPKLFQSFAVPW